MSQRVAPPLKRVVLIDDDNRNLGLLLGARDQAGEAGDSVGQGKDQDLDSLSFE